MRSKLSIRSLIVAVIMAFLFLASAPAIMSQTHIVQAKGKKATVKLNKSKVTVQVGKSKKIKAKCKKKVKWSLTDKSVAKIKKKGKKVTIIGKKDGVTALVAKCGKKKAVCRITVGKGCPYASISAKTKAALKMNAAQELTAYLNKRGGITLNTQNTSVETQHSDGDNNSWVSDEHSTYRLSAQGAYLVLEITESKTTHYAKYSDETTDEDVACSIDNTSTVVKTLYFPVDGTTVATYKYSDTDHEYNFDRKKYEDSTSADETTFDITSFNIGTALNWKKTENDTDSRRQYTTKDGKIVSTQYYDSEYTTTSTKSDYAGTKDSVVDSLNMLNAILVDNETGFTINDLGCVFVPSHAHIGVMTDAELSRYAAQAAAERAFYESAAYLNRTESRSSTTTYTSGERKGQTETSNSTGNYSNGTLVNYTSNSTNLAPHSDSNNKITWVKNTNSEKQEYYANGEVKYSTYSSTGTDANGKKYTSTNEYYYDEKGRMTKSVEKREGHSMTVTYKYYVENGVTYYDKTTTTVNGSSKPISATNPHIRYNGY